ncbi:MAG: hypothetical protein CVV41_18640 [Candidatus Riflebacteria bacterium HGW-Riflebacteria-1]|jgi:hypothetical protein|nr:MAG: hypothetical protein CVV41_18640 [Candidatus Riflebacteria bacterium HGW-Riflebacteria-1]
MKRAIFLVLCFVLLAGSSITAGPLVPADIDAEAVWYGHVDMQAIMQMPLIQEKHKSAIEKKKGKTLLAQLSYKMCIQLMGEFLSATMYATQYEGDFGVVLMKFRNDLPGENLHAIFAQKFTDHKETMIGSRKVYTWRMRCGRKHKQVSGCFVNDRQILVGIDLHHVERALEVLDGKRPAMTAHNPLFKGLTPGTLFVSRALDVPASYQGSTYCPVLRHCHEAFARWTSLGNTIRGRYEFQATDSEKAALYQQAVEGMKAMFTLRFSDYNHVLPLLDGFSNIQEGKAVILTWEGTNEQIRKAYEQIRQQRRIKKNKRKQDNKE